MQSQRRGPAHPRLQPPPISQGRRRTSSSRTAAPIKAPDRSNQPSTPAATPAPQSQSHLLALPAELRNKIYEFALAEPEPIRMIPKFKPLQPNLTLVSRQIRKESLQIFYHENVFQATRVRTLICFLRDLDPVLRKNLQCLHYDWTFQYLINAESALKEASEALEGMGFKGIVKARIKLRGETEWETPWVALEDLEGYVQAGGANPGLGVHIFRKE